MGLILGISGCKKSATTETATTPLVTAAPTSSAVAVQATPAPAATNSTQPTLDPCSLITKEEVEAVQESAIRETKASARSDSEFLVSQCFYMATEFTKSVNLSVTQIHPGKPGTRTPKQFWEETFGPYESGKESGEDKDKAKTEPSRERGREREEEKERRPPKKIEGIGEEAFWTPGIGGALYVLKNDSFIRISLGGADPEEGKIEKAKALAEKALGRLPAR